MCSCSNKLKQFIESEKFQIILKDAVEDAMRNSIHLLLKDEWDRITEKVENIELDLKYIRSKYKDLNKSEDESSESSDSSSGRRNSSEAEDQDQYSQGGRVQGVVKWYDYKKQYGFITVNNSKEQIFVHRRSITKPNPESAVASLKVGETVEFEIKTCQKGTEAANVTGVGGERVVGSNVQGSNLRNLKKHRSKNIARAFSTAGSEWGSTQNLFSHGTQMSVSNGHSPGGIIANTENIYNDTGSSMVTDKRRNRSRNKVRSADRQSGNKRRYRSRGAYSATRDEWGSRQSLFAFSQFQETNSYNY